MYTTHRQQYRCVFLNYDNHLQSINQSGELQRGPPSICCNCIFFFTPRHTHKSMMEVGERSILKHCALRALIVKQTTRAPSLLGRKSPQKTSFEQVLLLVP